MKKLTLASVLALALAVSAFAESAVTVLQVKKMTCSSCNKKVKDALLKVPGVNIVEIKPKSDRVEVTTAGAEVTSESLIAAVKGAGFVASVQK